MAAAWSTSNRKEYCNMIWVTFFSFFLFFLQGIYFRCDYVAIVGLVCFVISTVLIITCDTRKSVQIPVRILLVLPLCALVWAGFQLDAYYMGRIAEYRFGAIEAALLVPLLLFDVFLERKGVST
jgi:hypothetical protein